MRRRIVWLGMASIVWLAAHGADADWTRFRGPNGSGQADGNPPLEWSEQENLAWKTDLPGPGSSSPIVVGDSVLVTCYSGYGVDTNRAGDISKLRRHLLCLDLATGGVRWIQTVSGAASDDAYSGFLTEHGYASSTPVSDGERVFVFFGKAGVAAYDMEGEPLWRTNVGTESGPQRWGSAASPILYKDLVIVNAAEENEALVALKQTTGEQVWKAQATGLNGTWGTPVLSELPEGRTEILLAVPGEIWSFNADTGKLAWYATGPEGSPMCSSVIVDGGVVYAAGGRGGQCAAIRVGGKGDVTASNTIWLGPQSGGIPSPVLHREQLYIYNRGILNCVNALTGERLQQMRLTTRDEDSTGRGPGNSASGDYASPILVNEKLYITRRTGDVFVLETNPTLQLLAASRFASDGSGFNATPAVAGDRLIFRSNAAIYCVAKD